MDLSLIIVNWNTRELVDACLASLPAACADLSWQAIVVDNGSADGSAEMIAAKFPDVQLIAAGSNCGFSRGNNLALPQASGDYVLLLNPDTVCPPDSLQKLVAFARRKPDAGAVGPLLTTGDREPTITYGHFPRASFHWLGFLDPLRWIPLRSLQRRVVHIPDRSEPSHRVDYIAGACFLIPRAALEAVGPLDEAFFMYFEETDWCRRAHRLGLDIWYCADAEVIHLEGQAAGRVSQFSLVQFQKSYRIYLGKYHGAGKALEFRAAQFAEYALKALLRALRPGRRDKNSALARAYWTRAVLQLKSRLEISPP